MEKELIKKISSRENLERILDNLKDGVIAHDLERRIFFFNKRAEEITGYSRDEILGKDCHNAFKAPFCGNNCSFCGEQPNLGKTVQYPINIISKDGETKNIEMTVVVMKDDDGKDFGILATIRDNTELINLKIRAKELLGFSNIIGKTHKMQELFQQIRDVAVYDMPVHIYGETGTGKELVARAIHDQSPRSGAPFVPINCAALPEGLVESELFGHVKGSFSGAIRDKKGRFELAHEGTIFLDEISELPKNIQVKILRFLQEGTLEKVGSEKEITVNARIISAANKNLKKEVENKNFRDDLYYRLNVIPIDLPPLRERKNDIPILSKHFLNDLSKKNHLKQLTISDNAISKMMDYSWPGNVRELENVIQFAIIKSKNGIISSKNLPMEFSENATTKPERGRIKKLDLETTKNALIKTAGNKVKAAKILGVGRATLYRFIDEHPEVLPKDL